MKIKFIKTTDNNINYIDPEYGNILYCTDSNKTYFDNVNEFRINISLNVLILSTEEEKNVIQNPLINKAYIILESEKIYTHDGLRWSQIENDSQLNNIISSLNEFVSGIINKNGELYAPKTLASNVYMGDGSRLSANINSSRVLSVTKTKPVYVEATENDQRVFNIPFPITNYDFKENHMSIILRGDLLNTENYQINNDRLLLSKNVPGLNKGEMILFIFYYTEHIDLNDNVILTTQNIKDKSITSEKLSDNIRIDAYNIIETIDRIFFTKEEKEKLKGIEKNATCYHHPLTHPAIMIVQDALHNFITESERKAWNNKMDSDKVYTKEEIDKKFKDLVGDAPEALDTLQELAKALDNDENHAATFTKLLGEKATKKEVDDLSNVIKTKVNIDDYIRSPIYGTPSRVNKLNSTYLNLSVDDPNFKQYIDGMHIVLKINESNIGNTYLSINGLDPKKIITVEGYELIEGELVKDSLYNLRYNGTTGNFILQGKGGVKIRNTSKETYFVDKNQTITRGDVVDIIDNKVKHATPKVRVLSNLETTEDKYNSESNLQLFKVDLNRFIVFWKFKKVFQVQVFELKDKFINISPLSLLKPIVISKDCIEFKVDTIDGDNFILSYCDSKNKVTTQIVSVSKESKIQLLEPYVRDEDQLVANINIIYTQNQKAIIGWEYGNKTRCMLISTENNEISLISGRDNIDYPLNNYCFIDPTQILFCASKDKEIKGWILNISDNDFSNSSLVSLVSSKSVDFNQPILSLVGNKEVISEWTNKSGDTFYRQYIQIDFKGSIIHSEPFTIDNEEYRVKSDINPKYKIIKDGYCIAPSNMNYKMPSIKGGEGDKCIKITLSKIDVAERKYNTIETHCSINKVTADNISYDMLDDNTFIMVYNTKINKTDNTHLYFAVADVRKMPYGIAMSNAKQDELVNIFKW